MKYIISGTNRPGSRSRQIANIIQELYREQGEEVGILDLAEMPFSELTGQHYSGAGLPEKWAQKIELVTKAEGLIFVVPEYNGSMPGALKYFIDHWKYPDAFEFRPVCYVGLGGMFGGMRPVEHLQQVMGYRNAFQYPARIFLTNIFKTLQNGKLEEPIALQLLKDQVLGFRRFVVGLKSEGLEANSILAKRSQKLT